MVEKVGIVHFVLQCCGNNQGGDLAVAALDSLVFKLWYHVAFYRYSWRASCDIAAISDDFNKGFSLFTMQMSSRTADIPLLSHYQWRCCTPSIARKRGHYASAVYKGVYLNVANRDSVRRDVISRH